MLYTDFSEKVLGLQGAIIKKIETDKENINLFCEMERKVCKCPVCSAQTDKIHDYRTQIIKDIPIKGKKYLYTYGKDDTVAHAEKDFMKTIRFYQNTIE